jgi:intracellular multiplication protein IcmK
MKRTILATLLAGLAASACAQDSQTFAQQLQAAAPAGTQPVAGAPQVGQPAPVTSGQVQQGQAQQAAPVAQQTPQAALMAPSAGPSIYQNASPAVNPLSGQPVQPLGQQPVAQQAVQGQPQQVQYQQVQYQQAPVGQQYPQGQYPTGSAQAQGNALPPGAALALPPDSAPVPLPSLPSPGDQSRYFEQSMFTNTAMTPQQINELNQKIDARRRAIAQLPSTAPRPVTGSIRVSLNPGAAPALIRPFYGQVTSFVVVDSTGQAWPVENFRVGNATLFAVNRLDGPQGSTFTIDALDAYGQSNLVLKLAGVPAPVIIDLVAGQKEVDARVEVRVDRRGPNAAIMNGAQLPQGTSSALLPVLDGVTPEGGRPLSVSGDEHTRGWLMPDGTMVIRTPLKIISPASRSFVSSADGTNVYVFGETPTLRGLYNGQFVPLTITKGI